MSKSLGIVSSVAITFVTTLALNTALNYFSSDKGTISTSGPVSVNGTSVAVVSIENYTKETLSGIALELPVTTPLSAITSDSPVQLADSPGVHASQTRLITVNQVAPRRITRIFVSAPPNETAPIPRLTNTESAGLDIRDERKLRSPLYNALLAALFVAVFYAALSAALTVYFDRRMKELTDRLEKVRAEAEKSHDTATSRLSAVEARLAKQRLLLLARISDYATELQFWRSTVAKLLLEKGGTLKSADDVARVVTSSLRTHGTSDKPLDFEAIKVAAAWLSHAEEKADQR